MYTLHPPIVAELFMHPQQPSPRTFQGPAPSCPSFSPHCGTHTLPFGVVLSPWRSRAPSHLCSAHPEPEKKRHRRPLLAAQPEVGGARWRCPRGSLPCRGKEPPPQAGQLSPVWVFSLQFPPWGYSAWLGSNVMPPPAVSWELVPSFSA